MLAYLLFTAFLYHPDYCSKSLGDFSLHSVEPKIIQKLFGLEFPVSSGELRMNPRGSFQRHPGFPQRGCLSWAHRLPGSNHQRGKAGSAILPNLHILGELSRNHREVGCTALLWTCSPQSPFSFLLSLSLCSPAQPLIPSPSPPLRLELQNCFMSGFGC